MIKTSNQSRIEPQILIRVRAPATILKGPNRKYKSRAETEILNSTKQERAEETDLATEEETR
jgi:hypothetical protein